MATLVYHCLGTLSFDFLASSEVITIACPALAASSLAYLAMVLVQLVFSSTIPFYDAPTAAIVFTRAC